MGLPGSEDSLTIVEPFRHNISMWRTDGQTDVQPIAITCAVWLTHVKNNRPVNKRFTTYYRQSKSVQSATIYMCFIDYKKAFDIVSHDQLWITLLNIGFPLHIVDLIKKLYVKQQSQIRAYAAASWWFSVKRGVRHGCIVSSPSLFKSLSLCRKSDEGSTGWLYIKNLFSGYIFLSFSSPQWSHWQQYWRVRISPQLQNYGYWRH